MAIPIISIVLCVLTIVENTRGNAFRRWNDRSFRPEILNVHEDCSSGGCVSVFPEKRGGELEEEGADILRPVTTVLTSCRLTGRPWQLPCPCETQYDIIDLGLDNYPRYLATARCAPKACHNKFNACRLIHYKVHILRQRDTTIENDEPEEQQYVEQIALPESLRMKWQMKPMKIAVACVANEAKKN